MTYALKEIGLDVKGDALFTTILGQYPVASLHMSFIVGWKLFGKEWLKLLTDVTIQVPDGMVMYLKPQDQHTELVRNALLLYPYISNDTISHGKAAEILGITKYDLIELYNSLGLAYLSMDISEVEEELDAWEKLKGEGI